MSEPGKETAHALLLSIDNRRQTTWCTAQNQTKPQERLDCAYLARSTCRCCKQAHVLFESRDQRG